MTGITNENEALNLTPHRDRQKLSRESTPQIDSSPRPSLQMKAVNASSMDTFLSDHKKHTSTPDFKSSSIKSRSSTSPMSSPLRERFNINIYPEFETDRQSPTEHAIKKPTRREVANSASPEVEAPTGGASVEFLAKMESAKKKMKEMQQELKHARVERFNKQNQIDKIKNEIAKARAELDTLADIENQDEDELKKRLTTILDDIDENRAILQEAEELRQDGQDEFEKQEQEILQLMNEIPEKMIEADDLRTQINQ